MNPIIYRKGICDPHMHVFEDKVYLYATHDCPGYEDNFHMEDWQIWSSTDLINWRLESVIDPAMFHCGPIDQCWAVDAAYKNGSYYWYFSTGDWGVGVGTSDNPAGPFKDALSCALVDYKTPPLAIQKWDPCVFQDEDQSAYLIVGSCKSPKPWDGYMIAKLNEDMVTLAEPLHKIAYLGNACPEDKASIHKQGDRYYLTHSSFYAVSDHVYGPYHYVGNTGCNIDHGSYFTFHNQTYFASGGMDNANRYLRASFLAPCHYRANGEIVVDQKIMEYGAGQYDAAWERIEAKWYFKASRECKRDLPDGGFTVELKNNEYLYFPNISNIERNTQIHFYAALQEKSVVLEIREESLEGPLLGSCRVQKDTSKGNYQLISCSLSCEAGKKSLYFVMRGEEGGKGLLLDWFSFQNDKKRFTLEPGLSVMGRGAALGTDSDASWHMTLRNMHLNGAAMEGLADAGAGGAAELVITYACEKQDTQLKLYINNEYKETIVFPVTGSHCIGRNPSQIRVSTELNPGVNKVKVISEDGYQDGYLTLDHITVETKKTPYATYAAANGIVEPMGNGCWEGLPQRENDPYAFSGRVVKYLEKPGDCVTITDVDGGEGMYCTLQIRYSRGEQHKTLYSLLINDEPKALLLFEETGGFTMKKASIRSLNIQLKEGRHNTIRLQKEEITDSGIFIDAFSIVPLVDVEE